MDFLINTFNVLLYQPLFNALILLYKYIPGHDFGIAVIALTILTRVLFYPLGTKAIKSQKALNELQPKMREIQDKFKNEKDKQAKAMMELYKREKVNPLSGCLPLLIQLPILIALYRVFWKGLEPESMIFLYSFVPDPGKIDPSFLGIIDLSQPHIVLAFLAAIAQYFQTKMLSSKKKGSPPKEGDKMGRFSDMMQKQMLYFFPFFTFIILLKFPSAIGVYWVVVTIFAILQQKIVLRAEKKEKESHN